MKCSACGAPLRAVVTDLPFKVADKTIAILKNLPVLQCENCAEYLLTDPVMGRVEEILSVIDARAELEIVQFAA